MWISKGPLFAKVLNLAGVLGDSLVALRDGMPEKFFGEEVHQSGLDLLGGDGGILVVTGEPGGPGGDGLKHVADPGCHQGLGLSGYSEVRIFAAFTHVLTGQFGVDILEVFPEDPQEDPPELEVLHDVLQVG